MIKATRNMISEPATRHCKMLLSVLSPKVLGWHNQLTAKAYNLSFDGKWQFVTDQLPLRYSFLVVFQVLNIVATTCKALSSTQSQAPSKNSCT